MFSTNIKWRSCDKQTDGFDENSLHKGSKFNDGGTEKGDWTRQGVNSKCGQDIVHHQYSTYRNIKFKITTFFIFIYIFLQHQTPGTFFIVSKLATDYLMENGIRNIGPKILIDVKAVHGYANSQVPRHTPRPKRNSWSDNKDQTTAAQ